MQNMTCICTEVDHSEFDKTIQTELIKPIFIKDIANNSFCISIDLNNEQEFLDISLDKNEILASLKGKMGLYLLWIDEDYCGDHFDQQMLCVYVGKGYVCDRIKYDHIPNKWIENQKLYITFYECSNRIAVYLEQLFLEKYKFYFNKKENSGVNTLKTMWDQHRFVNGTETHEHAELLSIKYPSDFNP